MKPTDTFKKTIQDYLDNRAKDDELFAKSYAKENKNLDDCITYILKTVQDSGCNGFADDEIYSMAVHYYDEDNLEVGKPISGQVVVNHTVELTAEEKAKARKKAVDKIFEEERARLLKPKATKKPAVEEKVEAVKVAQPSLF